MLVLDTSVVSAIMRREAHAMARLAARHPADLVLCAPVGAEIGFGLARLPAGSRRRTLLKAEYDRLRGALPWMDWTEDAASTFGLRKARLEADGTPVGDMDVIIASIALAAGGGVATMNIRDFRRIHDLPVEDWTGS